ncbi:MAG: DeoR/GlpR family DNA-binding transcription regulator [bacterium]
MTGRNRQARLDQICEILADGQPARITDLATTLNVSVMTIRRDAEILVEQGRAYVLHGALVGRTHAAESMSSRYLLNTAKSVNRAEKAAIGAAAADLIDDSDTVVIDAGSTTEFLAESLPGRTDATVISYSMNVFLKAAESSNAHLILAGGEYHRDSKIFRGSATAAVLKSMRATKAFLSAGGVSDQLGVTCSNQFEFQSKRSLIDYSIRRILLVDHTKFDHTVGTFFADLSDFDTLVTDREPPSRYLDYCRAHDVEIIVAQA